MSETLLDQISTGSVAARLKSAREKRYLVAAHAASALGMRPVTLRAHESGQNGIGPEEAAKYAAAYGVTLEWLLTGVGGNSPPHLTLVQLPPVPDDDPIADLMTLAVRLREAGYRVRLNVEDDSFELSGSKDEAARPSPTIDMSGIIARVDPGLEGAGARLRELRRAAGISAATLAARVGLTEAAVRNQENGANGIPPPVAVQYAAILKTTPAFILFGVKE